MNTDALCPVCHEGELQVNYDLTVEIGDSRMDFAYVTLQCPCCGTVFRHENFDGGINFIDEWESNFVEPEQNEVENWADNEKEEWECSGCHVKRKKVKGAPAFKFCPDCGEPVWRY